MLCPPTLKGSTNGLVITLDFIVMTFLQGTALSPLLLAPLKYVQLIPRSCLGFALETLSACPCPSVLPTPARVGPFNKCFEDFLQSSESPWRASQRGIFKDVVSCKSKACLKLALNCIRFHSFPSSMLRQERGRAGRFHSFQLPINSRVVTLCLASNSIPWVPPPS